MCTAYYCIVAIKKQFINNKNSLQQNVCRRFTFMHFLF